MEQRKTVVITGASSGIGLATALQFAEQGYNLVLVARRKAELEQVAEECATYGAQTLVCALDMTNETDVNDMASLAADRFGAIDVWVNNASTYAAGKTDEIPLQDMRRVMDVNFFGYLIGARAAFKHFKSQGFGTLIDISSVNAEAPQPYGAIYGASKSAVRTMDEVLRMELVLDRLSDRIHVCTVLPSPVDTNLYRNSANYTGRELLAVEPVYSPEHVARHIVHLARHPKRERFIGRAGRLFALQHKFLPRLYSRTTPVYTQADVLGDTPAVDTPGNLYQPIETHRGMHGGWNGQRVSGEKVDKLLSAGLIAGGLLAAVGALLLLKDGED